MRFYLKIFNVTYFTVLMFCVFPSALSHFRPVSFLMQPSNLITGASAVSGFFASACSLPFDYVKTQIQKMQPDANGKYPYTGSLDCAMKTFKSGGPFKFYTGFPVYCVRIAPHVMVSKTGCDALFDNLFVYPVISLLTLDYGILIG